MPDDPIQVSVPGLRRQFTILRKLRDGVQGHARLWHDRAAWHYDAAKQEEWAGLPLSERMTQLGRQGARAINTTDEMMVCDPEAKPVPRDETLGEVMFRGNPQDEGPCCR